MIYTSEDGKRSSRLPMSEQQAIDANSTVYEDDGGCCQQCETENVQRWVGKPVVCASCIRNVWRDYFKIPTNNVVGHNHPTLCPNGPHLLRTSHPMDKRLGGCITCLELRTEISREAATRRGLPLPPHDHIENEGSVTAAMARGDTWYAPNTRCENCGTTAVRHVDSRCQGCWSKGMNRSPRQKALTEGEQWYTPDTQCKKCNTTSPRRTNNGRCQRCEELYKKPPTPRQLAITEGEQWYTPDTPCKHCDTTAPRRVNNGSCKRCEEKRKKTPQSAGGEWCTPDTPCDQCHIAAPRRISDGSCQRCEVINGRKSHSYRNWYMPKTACIGCHTYIKRHIATDECKACGTSNTLEAVAAKGDMWIDHNTPCLLCDVVAPVHLASDTCMACEEMTEMEVMVVEADSPVTRDQAEGMGLRVYFDNYWRFASRAL